MTNTLSLGPPCSHMVLRLGPIYNEKYRIYRYCLCILSIQRVSIMIKNTWENVCKEPSSGINEFLSVIDSSEDSLMRDAISTKGSTSTKNSDWLKRLFDTVVKNGTEFYNTE